MCIYTHNEKDDEEEEERHEKKKMTNTIMKTRMGMK